MGDQTDNTTVYTIEQLRDVIAPYVRERGMRWAGLFGSYARGEADGASDIDILVDRGECRALALGGLAEAVWSATGKHLDVVDVSQLIPGPFRDRVLAEVVAL